MQSFLHPIIALGLYWVGSCPRVHKKRQTARHLPLFAFYQNHSAGTNPGHHFPLCARTASRLSLGRRFPGDPRNGGGMPWFFTLAQLWVKK